MKSKLICLGLSIMTAFSLLVPVYAEEPVVSEDPLPLETAQTTSEPTEAPEVTIEPSVDPEVPGQVAPETEAPTDVPESVEPTVEPTETPEGTLEDTEVIPTTSPEIIETPVETTTPDISETEPSAPSNEITMKEMAEVDSYEIDGMKMHVQYTGMSVSDAQMLLSQQEQGIMTMATGTLIRDYRLAQFTGPNGPEYVSKFSINGLAAYCIEPLVLVILDGNGIGPTYDSAEPSDFTADQLRTLGRIIWYGYGHPLTGTSDEAYMATQLLMWQITDPDNYDMIVSSLKWCNDKTQACSSIGGAVDVTQEMNDIMNLVNNWDTVPSFADPNHGVTHYELDWDETLVLEDSGSYNYFTGQAVLDWFNEQPEESHQGINIKQDGNKLLIDIDEVYYEGHDTDEGVTLTFKRKDDQWEYVITALALWISGDSQRLMTFYGVDPTPEFKLSFSLRTSNIEVTKLDEFYEENNLVAGTTFRIGWYGDPTDQYRHDGGADANWTDKYNYNTNSKPDTREDSWYDPSKLMYVVGNNSNCIVDPDIVNYDDARSYSADSTCSSNDTGKLFTVGADGKLHIDGVLPRGKTWWIQEVDPTNPYDWNGQIWKINTPEQQNATNYQEFVNALRDIDLQVVKLDDETEELLNGATFEIYEISKDGKPLDTSKEDTEYGNHVESSYESLPFISASQITSNLPNPEVGDSFYYNGYIYTIVGEDDNQWHLTALRYDAANTSTTNPIRYNQIPEGLQTGDTFTVKNTDVEPGYEVPGQVAPESEIEFEIISVSSDFTIIKWTDTSKKITLNESSDPSISDLGLRVLTVGQDLAIGDTHYKVTDVQTDAIGNITSITLAEGILYTIKNDDGMITYQDLPENVKNGSETSFVIDEVNYTANSKTPHLIDLTADYDETFVVTEDTQPVNLGQILDYLNSINKTRERVTLGTHLSVGQELIINGVTYIVDAIDSVTETIDGFDVITVNSVTLRQHHTYDFQIDVPPMIDYQDVPETVEPTNTFSIVGINNPVYTVTDNLNLQSTYEISDKGTFLIDGDTKTQITDGSVIGYMELIGSMTTNNGGACEDPFNPAGCPVGLARDFIRRTKVEHPYDGVQYDDIQALLDTIGSGQTTETLVAGDTFEYNGVTYTVVNPVDSTATPITLTVSFVPEGYSEPVNVTLPKADTVTSWTETVEETITYTITEATPKEYIVFWDAQSLGRNTIYSPEYDPDFNSGNGTVVITTEGIKGQNGLIKWEDKVNYVLDLPLTYEELAKYETDNQVALKTGDSYTNTSIRDIRSGDEFEVNGITYTVYQDRDNTAIFVYFSEEQTAPFTYEQVMESFSNNNVFEASNSNGDWMTYTVSSEKVNGESVIIVEGADGTEYHFWRYKLTNDALYTDGEEGLTSDLLFKVDKPAEITWADYLTVYPSLDAVEGDTFALARNGNEYEVISVNDDGSVAVKNVATKKEFTLSAATADPNAYETSKIYFIEKGSILDLAQVFPIETDRELVYQLSDTAHATVDGSMISADDLSYFTLSIVGANEPQPLTMDQVMEQYDAWKEEQLEAYNTQQALFKEHEEDEEAIACVLPQLWDGEACVDPLPSEEELKLFFEVGDTFTVEDKIYTITEITWEDPENDPGQVAPEQLKVTTPNTVDPSVTETFNVYRDEEAYEKYTYAAHVYASYTIAIVESNNGKGAVTSVEGLLYGHGTTGENGVRVVDPYNHNVPVPNKTIGIYEDPDGLYKVMDGTTDNYGYLSTDELEPGTYYYLNTKTGTYMPFTVYDENSSNGTLHFSDLKWGRTYMACEVGLPEGYDYASDPCFEVTLETDPSVNSYTQYVDNRIRHLDLTVYKEDQDDVQKRLNGAYFTVTNITNAGEDVQQGTDSKYSDAVTINDIMYPEELVAGDTFTVWHDLEGGATTEFTITEITDAAITVKDSDGWTTTVPVDGINASAGMCYNDIIRWLDKGFGIDPEVGDSFIAHEKVEGDIQTYRVIEVVKWPDGTEPSEENHWVSSNDLRYIVIENVNDQNHAQIILYPDYYPTPEVSAGEYLGTYVSGAFYEQVVEPVQVEPVLWDDMINTLGNDLNALTSPIQIDAAFTTIREGEDGASITTTWTITDVTTDYMGITYEEIPNVDSLEVDDLVTVRGVTYKVADIQSEPNVSITLQDATGTDADGNLLFENPAWVNTYTPNQKHDATIMAVTVMDKETGTSINLYPGMVATYEDMPIQGIKYVIATDEQFTDIVATGETDKNGEVVIWEEDESGDFLNGHYWVRRLDTGKVTEIDLEPGRIYLPDFKYGDQIEVCETKSPLGYIVGGQSCEVITMEAEYNEKNVINHKTNKKITYEEEGGRRRRVRIRKMGEDISLSIDQY